MKEENYYIPSIEEFYVGFEYEKTTNFLNFDKWQHCVFGKTNTRLDTIKQNLYSKEIRVKYLNKEDIESLGVKTDTKNNYIFGQFNKEEFYLDYHIPTHYLIISSLDDDFFRGFIYNKSEFQKLLKQLQIN